MWEWWKEFYTNARAFEALLGVASIPLAALILFILHKRNKNDR